MIQWASLVILSPVILSLWKSDILFLWLCFCFNGLMEIIFIKCYRAQACFTFMINEKTRFSLFLICFIIIMSKYHILISIYAVSWPFNGRYVVKLCSVATATISGITPIAGHHNLAQVNVTSQLVGAVQMTLLRLIKSHNQNIQFTLITSVCITFELV